MRTSKKYTKELKRQFNYLATWLPGTPLALGDIGILRRNRFTKISNLEDLGIQFEVEKDESKTDIEHSSIGAVSITTKASGTAALEGSMLGKVDAGAVIEFSKEKAIYFKANGITSPSIKDQIGMANEILKLYKQGKWEKNWVVITELVHADSATILISSSSKGKAELKAKATVGIGGIDPADVASGFELSFSKDLTTKIIAEEGLTPLFKASKIKSRVFSKPIFKTFQFNAMELSANGLGYMDLMTPTLAKENEEMVYLGDADFEDNDEDS